MRPTHFDPSQFRMRGQARNLRRLLPYLWPAGRADLKARVAVAVVMLVAAKLTNVYVPILLRGAVDGLSPQASLAVALPLGFILAYGAARVLAIGFGQLRDAVFAKVAQHAIREVALKAFRHLHALSLRFHLERQTGGLNRALERGTKGIEFLLFFVIFNVVPTLLEIGLVCGILWWIFDWRFAAVTAGTVAAYIVFTFKVTELRIVYRRRMNDADSAANTKAIDSLLNFETVKYFGNEDHEARRYDLGLRDYESARRGQEPHQPLGAQHRPGGDHRRRHHGDYGHDGARRGRRHDDRGRLRHGQRLLDTARHAAQLPRHRLPRDQAVAGRHGGDVRLAGGAARGVRQTGRAGARRQWWRDYL
jgi:ATP-binding cassette subfamily B protein